MEYGQNERKEGRKLTRNELMKEGWRVLMEYGRKERRKEKKVD